MIKVTTIPVQTVEHFDDKGNSLEFLNEYESLELRCQIAEQKISGYYLIFDDERIYIQPDGRIKNWPTDLFSTNEKLFARLFTAQRSIKL